MRKETLSDRIAKVKSGNTNVELKFNSTSRRMETSNEEPKEIGGLSNWTLTNVINEKGN